MTWLNICERLHSNQTLEGMIEAVNCSIKKGNHTTHMAKELLTAKYKLYKRCVNLGFEFKPKDAHFFEMVQPDMKFFKNCDLLMMDFKTTDANFLKNDENFTYPVNGYIRKKFGERYVHMYALMNEIDK